MDYTHEQAKWGDRPAIYRIRVQGLLDPQWADWFDNLALIHEGTKTLLTGQMADQAALYGVINRINALGLTLLLVQRVDEDQDPMGDGSGGSADSRLPAEPPTP